jgi:hypothetical protein
MGLAVLLASRPKLLAARCSIFGGIFIINRL